MARQPLRNEDLHADILSGMGVEEDEDTNLDVDPDDDDLSGDTDSGDNDNDNDTTDPVDDNDEELTQRYQEDPKTRNLVDKSGKVVAKAGQERTVLERTKKALTEKAEAVTVLTNRLRQVAAAGTEVLNKYKELQQESNYHKTIGLSKEQSKEAQDLYARFNTDPKGALKHIMTKMHLNGVDLSDIGVSTPLDAKAIADQAISEYATRNKPVQKTPEENAKEEAMSFLNRHPDAASQTEIIAQAKQRYPHLSLDTIWFKLSIHNALHKIAREQGLDPRKGKLPEKRPDARNRPVARNSVDHSGKRKALDLNPRDHKQSFEDIGKELLRDIRALEQ